MSARTVVVAGGGTGGHVYPVLEVIRELHAIDPELKFFYIGQRRGIEAEILAKAKLPVRVPFHGITTDKLRRYMDVRTLLLPFSIMAGVIQSFGILQTVRPIAVFCKGGYVGVPVAVAAWLLRIPIVLHETDSVMGLANRMIAPFASKIAVSYPRPKLGTGNVKSKLLYTGNPVRPEFFEPVRERPVGRPRLVITAGSQGSVPINTLIGEILPQLLERYDVVHITGTFDFGRMKAKTSDRNYRPLPYADNIVEVLRQADLVVTRAGGTVFELAALGKPAILIPLPTAGSDHQRINAKILVDTNAAVSLEPTTLTSAKLLETIRELMQDSKRRAELGRNIRSYAKADAAKRVAELIMDVARTS